jgi:hypothetical protein
MVWRHAVEGVTIMWQHAADGVTMMWRHAADSVIIASCIFHMLRTAADAVQAPAHAAMACA